MEQVTNDVLAERIDGLKHLLLDKLDSIEKQTIKTNGRTTKSEDNIKNIDGKINKFIGGLVVINAVLGIALTIALAIYKN